jgi:hypothetical protein
MKLLGKSEEMPQLEAKLADAGAAYAAVEATAQQQLEVPVQTQQLLADSAIEKLKKVRAGKEGGIWWAGVEEAVAIVVPAVADVGSSNHWHSRCCSISDPSSSTVKGHYINRAAVLSATTTAHKMATSSTVWLCSFITLVLQLMRSIASGSYSWVKGQPSRVAYQE